jgi:glutaredoxin
VPPAARRVTLIAKPGCHLCDEARDVIAAVCGELGVAWDEVDVRSDPALWAEHGERIPVTLVDGEEHDFWRVRADALRAALLR